MNDEIKEILDMFTKYKDDWYSCEYKLKPKQCVAVLDYITNLQQENEHLRTQVNTYENPDDYTLFYMWLDAKAKDKMKQLQEENERLKEKENKLQEKFKDWKKEIEKEMKHYLCDRTDCFGRIKDSKKYRSLYQENERLKELCDKYEEEHNNEFKIWKAERHQLLDYKSRCEKANQYIKKNTHEYKMFNEELGHFSNLTNISIDKNNKVFINDLLNILGGDEE